MSPALLDPPRRLEGPAREGARAGAVPARGPHVTLEDRLEAVWRAAQRDERTECPVCQAPMSRLGAAAHCEDCGARLS